MKKLLTSLLALALAVSALAVGPKASAKKEAEAGMKKHVVVIVDMSRIYKEAKISREIQTDFSSWNAQFRAKFQKKLADLKAKQEDLKKNEATLTKEEKDEAKKAIDAAQKDLSQTQMQARQEFQQRQKAAEEKLHSILDPVLDKLGKENGWDVILDKGAKDLVWNAGGVDETDLILKKLDEATPEPPKPPAPAKEAPKPQPKH